MRIQATRNTEAKPRIPARVPARCGRPPRELAGEVEKRILAAAQKVFLDRGFEGASIEEIAVAAQAGKPTIYARHPSKESLFTAVVMRDVAERLQFENIEAMGTTLEERLTFFGGEILRRGLRVETVGLFRTVIAEAQRFPALASSVGQAARAQIVDLVSRLFRSFAESERISGRPNTTVECLPDAARVFCDLIFLPMILRGLLGEPLEALRAEIPAHVDNRVSIFLSACSQSARTA